MTRRSGVFEPSSGRARSVKDVREKVLSVSGEQFKHIVYYPVFDLNDEQTIVAVMEVGYKKTVEQPLLTEDMQAYLD